MPKTDRFRALYVLKYLWEHTDKEHPVTLAQIQTHLSAQGIEAIPKTIDGDITALQDLGFDIIPIAAPRTSISSPAVILPPLS